MIRNLALIFCIFYLGTNGLRGELNSLLTNEFARDIRPLLSEYCFECHGPDAAHREADLRLDVQTDLFAESSAGRAIVDPGQPEDSELWRRIISADDDERMPPPDVGKRLSPQQMKRIRLWIEQGAVWQSHWAFAPPRPVPPPQPDEMPMRNPIDAFIRSSLRQRGLTPAAPAPPETLIRRVSLDLVGLPPTPAETQQFLSDDAPDAYERVVDRLLDSPRYGERMAAMWLDAARYADSYGYQDDGEVSMWRCGDWVIDAFNSNLPFDQFTVEQLAGDLLSNPTPSQRIATGFNRNHRANSEGGAIPEEFRVEYVVDRVDTTATVWLGMTMVCARCHDHKYDPLSQREFYEMFAFFNNVDEDGRARKNGNTPPLMAAPTREQQLELERLEAERKIAEDKWAGLQQDIQQLQAAWEQSSIDRHFAEFTVTREMEVRLRLDDLFVETTPQSSDAEPRPLLVRAGSANYCRGKIERGVEFDGQLYLDASEDFGHFSDDDPFSLAVWVRPTSENGGIVSHVELPDDPRSKGYSLVMKDGQVRFHAVSQWIDDSIRVITQNKIPLDRWTHVLATYDASQTAHGVHIYFDGVEQPLDVEADCLFQGFSADQPVLLGTCGGPTSRFQGAMDDFRIYEVALTADEAELLATPDPIQDLLRLPAADRTPPQQRRLRAYFLEHHAPPSIAEANRELERLKQQVQSLTQSFPTVMVMRELASPRTTRLLQRGRYDAPGETVTADVPSVLPPLPADAPRNRLGFAKWLVMPEHPLTARVVVNRLWQMSFGVGLVKTAENFGVQGEPPSHPELLDWLAMEFVRSGWDVKALRRMIVTSDTYRQSSRMDSQLWALDPENRWLAHGPRFRLPAEMIRDQALFVSGLLVERLGGPSVRPYQPARLWLEMSDKKYEQDHGEKLYRRSLYTFWKRTVPHPVMMAFDATNRETCSVRESRTNTPLQALTLLNEDGFVEAARVLAERVLTNRDLLDNGQRISHMFQLTTGRARTAAEEQLLQDSLQHHCADFAARIEDAQRFVRCGESRSSLEHHESDVVELAALTTVANMLLNLDETVTQH